MNVSPEIELMIGCAKVKVDQDSIEKIQELCRGGLDWDSFIKTCTSHKVLPLVFQTLSSAGADSFPEKLRSQLEENYKQSENRLSDFLKKQSERNDRAFQILEGAGGKTGEAESSIDRAILAVDRLSEAIEILLSNE